MSKAAELLRGWKVRGREVRNFVLLTAVLTGLFTAGAEAALAHAQPAALCSFAKFVR